MNGKRTKIKPYVFYRNFRYFLAYSPIFLSILRIISEKMKGSKMITIMSLAHNEMCFFCLYIWISFDSYCFSGLFSIFLSFNAFFSSFASFFLFFYFPAHLIMSSLYTNIVVNRTELHNFPAFVLIKQNDSCVCNKNILQAEYTYNQKYSMNVTMSIKVWNIVEHKNIEVHCLRYNTQYMH